MKIPVWSGFKPKEFVQPVEAAFLLVEVGMDVEVERCSHIGVTEDDTDRLIGAAALDTSGGKGMAQSGKSDRLCKETQRGKD